MLQQRNTHDWARRLIASEVKAASPHAETVVATLHVYERLRRQLLAPVGMDGFQALATRALVAARSRSPQLRGLQIRSDGMLSGLQELESHLSRDERNEVGVILISELLALFLTLLGEAATTHLVEDAVLPIKVKENLETKGTRTLPEGTSYLGPFEDILLEAGHLRQVSEHLETLAHTHTGVDELMSVAGNIRNIANVLDVFTLVRGKAGASEDSDLCPPVSGFLN